MQRCMMCKNVQNLFPPLYNWWGLVSILVETVEGSRKKKAPALSLLQLPVEAMTLGGLNWFPLACFVAGIESL